MLMRFNRRVSVGTHGGAGGRLSISERLLFDCGIRQALQNLSDICMDADGLPLNFLRANRLTLVDADIGGVRVLGCHLPEGVLDDDRCIVPNAQFQKEDFPACTGTEKILIPLCCSAPALVLYKFIIAAQVHGQRLAAVGTDGEQLGRDFHILLPLDHFTNDRFVIKSFLTARLTALEQTVIALRVEQAALVKSRFLKTVVNIRGDNKIVLIGNQLQKVLIDRFGGIPIAVAIDISAPIRPEFFLRGERIKAAGIHILDTVLCRKVGKVFFEPLVGVNESSRDGKPRPPR